MASCRAARLDSGLTPLPVPQERLGQSARRRKNRASREASKKLKAGKKMPSTKALSSGAGAGKVAFNPFSIQGLNYLPAGWPAESAQQRVRRNPFR
jgi:hypothetical protein